MRKEYNADDIVIANLKLNDESLNRQTGKYAFVKKYSKILDISKYKEIVTKKKYLSYIYKHYAGDFYLINIEKYTTYFPEHHGKKVDEKTILMNMRTFKKQQDLEINKERKTEYLPSKEVINVNKQVKKYKKEIEKLLYDEKDIKSTKILMKMVPILFFVLSMFATRYMIPGILIDISVSVVITTLCTLLVNKMSVEDSIYQAINTIGEDNKKKYNEIINKAKELNKIYNSKKLRRFLKAYEIKQEEKEENQEVLDYCVSMNEEIRKKDNENNKTKVIGSLNQEKKKALNIKLSRKELETLLNGEMIMINAKEPIKVQMKEDIYSSLDKNSEALKESSRKNKSMIKKRGRIK